MNKTVKRKKKPGKPVWNRTKNHWVRSRYLRNFYNVNTQSEMRNYLSLTHFYEKEKS